MIISAYLYREKVSLIEEELKTINIINYSFGHLRLVNGIYKIDLDQLPFIKENLKYQKNNIKIVLSIGGWQNDPHAWDIYEEASRDEIKRKKVAEAIKETIITNGFDGIDLDWEYPKKEIKYEFYLLIKEIYNTLKQENNHLIVSIAIPAGIALNRYDLENLNTVLDYFNVMSYDLEDSKRITHHSSLYPSENTIASVQEAVDYMLINKVSPEKIIIGAAFYGKRLTIEKGFYSKKASISYSMISELERSNNYKIYYDDKAKAYMLYNASEVITYDNKLSIIEKLKYVQQNNLAGLMYWSYTNDLTHELNKTIYKFLK